MSRWYRVFASRPAVPSPAAILDHLAAEGVTPAGEFAADASGWYQADLVAEGVTLKLERYGAGEEGIRAELNSWAAWLETCEDSPEHARLMERMIQTAQLFTLSAAEESARADSICVGLCQFLARLTKGVYQIDGRGLFAADGTLLVPE